MLAQSWLFVVVFLVLILVLGYLSNQYRTAKDITQAISTSMSLRTRLSLLLGRAARELVLLA